jgi:hypothetical protein
VTVDQILRRVAKMPAVGADADVIQAARDIVDNPSEPWPWDDIPNVVLLQDITHHPEATAHVRPDPA